MLRLVGQLIQPHFHSAEEFWQDDRVLHEWKAAMEMFEFGSGLVSPFKESVPKRQMISTASYKISPTWFAFPLVHLADSLVPQCLPTKSHLVLTILGIVMLLCLVYRLQPCLRFATQHKSPTTATTLLLMRCHWQRHAWIRADEFPPNSSVCHCCASEVGAGLSK